jgi:hypothetical protein
MQNEKSRGEETKVAVVTLGTLACLTMVGLIAGDPVGYCGAASSSACFRTIGTLAGPISVAILTLVIAYGQYTAGRRQAAAADLQVRLAAVPIVESDIRSYQELTYFIVSFRRQVFLIENSLEHVIGSIKLNEPISAYIAEFSISIDAFDQTHSLASQFFDQLKHLIIPSDATGIQNAFIKIGSNFASGVGPMIFQMRTYIDRDGSSPDSVRIMAMTNVRTGLETTKRLCSETITSIDIATGEIAEKVQKLHAKRSDYLNSLI